MSTHKELLTRYAAYNGWANKRIVGMVAQAADKDFDTEVPSSFNTLRKTLYHCWDAQVIWLLRLEGESITTWPSKDFTGDFAAFEKAFLAQSQALHHFVRDAGETFLAGSIHYANTRGEKFESSVEDILLHVFNHTTYHRGQVITMLRQLGYTQGIGSTDMILFARE